MNTRAMKEEKKTNGSSKYQILPLYSNSYYQTAIRFFCRSVTNIYTMTNRKVKWHVVLSCNGNQVWTITALLY